ncbi:MAG: STAS/SEC14 domain-containing protein [Vibrio sp.]
MTTQAHGLAVAIDKIGPEFIIAVKAVGTLTHDDYEQFAPMIEAAVVKVNMPKIKLLFDAREFEGWELRAAWDDVKLGLTLGAEFDKIAIYGMSDWQDWLANFGRLFVHGELKTFDNKEQAVDWLV